MSDTAFLEPHVGFPAAAREVQIEGDSHVFESFQLVSLALAGELPQSVLVALAGFLHAPLLSNTKDHQDQAWSF